MHLVKISDDPLTDGTHRYYCPYCKNYLKGNSDAPLVHKCSEAGFTLIVNGHLFVDVQSYIENEKKGAKPLE